MLGYMMAIEAEQGDTRADLMCSVFDQLMADASEDCSLDELQELEQYILDRVCGTSSLHEMRQSTPEEQQAYRAMLERMSVPLSHEPIRCKDCKYHQDDKTCSYLFRLTKTHSGYSELRPHYVDDEDFCSKAERSKND